MKHINSLIKLLEQKELNYSQLPKTLIESLKAEGLIAIKTISPKRKKVIAKEELFLKYDLNILYTQKEATTRAELARVGESKAKKISPQDGLYINGKCDLGAFSLPITNNSSLFLKDIPPIDENILIIIVENFEPLIYCHKLFKYFQDDNILFVYRNSKTKELLQQNIKNKIIHFGDFDLAGIDIFQTQILPYKKDAEFFIPDDIEVLIKEYGQKKLYQKQIKRYKNLTSNNINLEHLIDIIHKYQKALEQEFFLGV